MMYARILRKDLTRKRTMNVILFLFVVLSTMFAASSVNNIMTVVNGLDYYFEKAGMSNYLIIDIEKNGESHVEDRLKEEEAVLDYRREWCVLASSDNFLKDGQKLADFSNNALIMSIDEAKLTFFDSDDRAIREIKRGEAYITGSLARKHSLKVGEEFEIVIGEARLRLTFAGAAKDAFLGSDFTSNPRFLLNDEDFRALYGELDNPSIGDIYYVNTEDEEAVETAISNESTVNFNKGVSTVKMTYVMDMIVAGLLLIVSVCLILIAFVVLRFTIGFTLSQEFREIGVMKAIGIGNPAIRGLYLVKYLGISLIGGVVGFAASIPFGAMMLSSVSENMVLGNEHSMFIGVLCSLAVVGIILLFCWSCTRRVNKLSPIDAVRSGQTGERFRKKSLLRLDRSRLGTVGFLATNDVASSPKQFGIITIVFTVCLLLVLILANTANTLNSEKLLFLFGTTKSDVYYTDVASVLKGMINYDGNAFDERISEIEQILDEHDMPGRVHVELLYKLPVSFEDRRTSVMFSQCRDTRADEYVYEEGSAPKYANEIALSKPLAKRLGAAIGDTVTLSIGGVESEFLITALFQTFNQLGESGRLHEDVETSMSDLISAFSFQIDFYDSPDGAEIDRRVEQLKEIFDTENVFNAADFVKDSTGSSEAILAVKNMVLMIVLMIIAMITVLMERSFITKETTEIALMKALGFRDFMIGMQHVLRFVIVGVLASVISVLLCLPLTKLVADPIFSMMGAVSGVLYEVRPVEIFLVYPVMVVGVILGSAGGTALYVRGIRASEVSEVE